MVTDSNAKLRELMIHIAKKTESCARFGSIKMNKALFYSDFIWYGMTGESMTGAMYLKEDYGPAPRGVLPVQEDLRRDGSAVIEKRPVLPKGIEKRLVVKADRTAALDGLFTPGQIALVDKVVDWLIPATAKEISEETHRILGWRLADYKQEIPYCTVFLDDDIAKPSDVQRGVELAKERGWTTVAT